MSAGAILAVTTAITAGAKIFGGISAKNAADDQAALLQEQARIQREETQAEAVRKSEERNRFIAKQKVAFLASGVGLAGTGLIVLQDTFNEFGKEIASLKRSGVAKAGLLDREAKNKRRSGKAALISGVLGAGSSIAGNAFKGKEAEVF